MDEDLSQLGNFLCQPTNGKERLCDANRTRVSPDSSHHLRCRFIVVVAVVVNFLISVVGGKSCAKNSHHLV